MRKLLLSALLLSSVAQAQDTYSALNMYLTRAEISALIVKYHNEHSEIGPPGPAGPKGDKGDTGDKGINGTNGIDGKNGSPGVAGRDGATGPAGPAGASIKGDKGDTGATGERGPVGASGAAGRDGVNGINGKDGAQGIAGNNGKDGTNGINGNNGATGATGPQGPSGATFLSDVTFGETATVVISAGFRKVTVPLTGCLAGDRLLLTPTANLPTGFAITNAYCLTANNLTINIYAAVLNIGDKYSITSKVTVFR